MAGQSKRKAQPKKRASSKPAPKPQARAKEAPSTALAAQKTESLSLMRKSMVAPGFSYSPWSPTLVPTAQYECTALPIQVTNRHVVPLHGDGVSRVYCYTTTGNNNSLGFSIDNATTPVVQVLNTAMLGENSMSGGPTSGRVVKLGARIVNQSRSYDIGGRVLMLRTNQRLDVAQSLTSMTRAEVNTLINDIYAHPHTKVLTGHEFKAGKSEFVVPRDHSDYLDYKEWDGPATIGRISGCSTTRGDDGVPFPMEAIWVVFQDFGVSQTYQVTLDAMVYTRWPLDHHSSRSQRPIPTMDPTRIATVQKREAVF
jgi:hypothetical protein